MEEQEVKMWSLWQNEGCSNAQYYLYEKYQKWAEGEAAYWFKKIRTANSELSDFLQYATIGLLEAMNTFDFNKGILFKTYAQYRVKGVILNNIFSFSDISAYKNSVYENDKDDQPYVDDLIESKGLLQAIEELAIDYLLTSDSNGEVTEDKVLKGCYYSSYEMASLKSRCKNTIENLTEPVRSILSLHYLCEVSLTDIAKGLDLSLSRVSQLKRQGLEELERMLL